MFTYYKMQEILNSNLPRNYRNELTSKEYNINEQLFSKTIDRLEAAELVLKLNKPIDKVHGGGKARKRSHNGTEKVTIGEKK